MYSPYPPSISALWVLRLGASIFIVLDYGPAIPNQDKSTPCPQICTA